MTTFLLIRHGVTDQLGVVVSGRATGNGLNEEGRRQAADLPGRLQGLPIGAIYSSPLQRTLETAAPLARRLGLEVRTHPQLVEIDYGQWTGAPLAALRADDGWRRYNEQRSRARVPGGEMLLEAQVRAVAALEVIYEAHPEGLVAVVSHGDVIRAAVALYCGVPLDLAHRLEIGPASVSALELAPEGTRLLVLNHVGAVPLA